MLFVINGYPGAGKDTFVNYVKKHWDLFKLPRVDYKNVKIVNISTIDYLKEIFKEEFNWDGEKTPEVRNALATIHKALNDWNDLPFTLTYDKIKEEILKGNIVFLHCREPYNIERYVEKFNGQSVFIENEKAKNEVLSKSLVNASDLEVENYNYNITIHNNASLEKLEEQAKTFVFECILSN
jgi:thymidylate kinase